MVRLQVEVKGNKTVQDWKKQLIATQFVKGNLRKPLNDDHMMKSTPCGNIQIKDMATSPHSQTWEIIFESIFSMYKVLNSIQEFTVEMKIQVSKSS